jgi:uncharacterized protein involved in exopolysaccharide biosynthesis
MDKDLKDKQSSDSDEIDLIEVFRKIWDGRKTIFKWMGIFFVIGIIIVIASPKEYKSEITLLVETGSGSNGMSGLLQQFGGLAGLSGLGSGQGEDALTPELYPDIIKSTPFLLEIMNEKVTDSKYDSTISVQDYIERHNRPGVGQVVLGNTLGLPGKIIGWIKGKPKIHETKIPKQKGPLKLTPQQSGIIGELANRIKAKQGESNSTLVISVEMQDPKVAALLVDSVVKSLTTYIIDYRTQKAKTDLKFVEERHKEAEEKYRIAQRNLAGYKDRNKNVILASALTSEQNLQAEYNLAFNIYNTLSQQLEQAKMKVQEKTPVFKVVEPAKVALMKSKPRTSLILVGMFFLGGFVGMGIILSKTVIHNFQYSKL